MQTLITVILEADRNTDFLSIKEALVNYVEQFGDIVKVDVQTVSHQTTLKGGLFS